MPFTISRRTALILEADSRGLLSPEQQGVVEEGRKRGFFEQVFKRPAELLIKGFTEGLTDEEFNEVAESGIGDIGPTVIGMAKIPGVPNVSFKKSFQDILGKMDKHKKFPSKIPGAAISEASVDVGSNLETFITNLSGKEPAKIIRNLISSIELRNFKALKKAGVTSSEQTASQLKALQIKQPAQFQRFDETLGGELTSFINTTLGREIGLTSLKKLGKTSFKEFGALLKKGDPKVLNIIREAQESGVPKDDIADFVRNRLVIEVAEAPKGAARDAVRATIAKLEPQINKLLRSEAAVKVGRIITQKTAFTKDLKILQNPDITDTGIKEIIFEKGKQLRKQGFDTFIAKNDILSKNSLKDDIYDIFAKKPTDFVVKTPPTIGKEFKGALREQIDKVRTGRMTDVVELKQAAAELQSGAEGLEKKIAGPKGIIQDTLKQVQEQLKRLSGGG